MGTMLAVLLAVVAPHVRPTDAMAREAFDRGRTRSRTFARLVQELERSRVIVHVETSLRLRSTIGGQFFLVSEGADGGRFLDTVAARDVEARVAAELLGRAAPLAASGCEWRSASRFFMRRGAR